MKHFLLLMGLLLAAGQVSAVPLAAALPVAAAPALAAPDTLAALQRLFAARRKRQGYATGATALVAIGTLLTLTSSQPARTSGSSGSGFAVIGPNDLGQLVAACVTLPLIPVVAIGFGGWGHKYERQVIATWQQQHQLPRHLKRQLQARYFQELPH